MPSVSETAATAGCDVAPTGQSRIEYSVILTDEAFYAYASLPSERLFMHVDKDLELLSGNPYLGRVYDPAYPAARPPFDCRVLYCEHLGIYYRADDDLERIVVFAIEDQRRNPHNRFRGIAYSMEKFDDLSE